MQLGNIHTLQANKTTNLNIDYYVCNLEGLTEFGVNNDLKLRINVDTKNTNTTTKLRLNNVDYTLLKEYNGTLKQIEAGDFKPNKSYELAYNGNQICNNQYYRVRNKRKNTVFRGKEVSRNNWIRVWWKYSGHRSKSHWEIFTMIKHSNIIMSA